MLGLGQGKGLDHTISVAVFCVNLLRFVWILSNYVFREECLKNYVKRCFNLFYSWGQRLEITLCSQLHFVFVLDSVLKNVYWCSSLPHSLPLCLSKVYPVKPYKSSAGCSKVAGCQWKHSSTSCFFFFFSKQKHCRLLQNILTNQYQVRKLAYRDVMFIFQR